MKNRLQALLMALMTFGAIHHAAAQGTAFTYQGRLNDSGQCANGQFDMQFQLYASAIGGTPLYASTTATSDVLVTNGLFTVTLDFGPVFTGATYFLETDVRTNFPGSGLPYIALAPRLQVLPVPYAVYAGTAGWAATATNFSGSVGGNISGTQGSLVVTTVGGQTAASIAQGVVAANNATPSNAPNSIVARDTNGNFSANALTLSGGLNMPDPAVFYSGSNVFLIEEGSLYLGKNGGSAVISPLDTLHNTGFGDYALNYEAVTGSGGGYNTAVGEDALQVNASGAQNTATGYRALFDNSSGFDNAADGFEALASETSGHNNTAMGPQALYSVTSGFDNVAMGAYSLFANTGSQNTVIGTFAAETAPNDSQLVAIGYGALQNDNAANEGTASGYGENVAVGFESLQANLTGNGNTAIGYLSLTANTDGNGNTADGNFALRANINGNGNTALGYAAMQTSATSSNEVAVGYQALENSTNLQGSTAIGYQALKNSYYYVFSDGFSSSSYGDQNTAVGYQALLATTYGQGNTAVGYQALRNTSTGVNNIALGYGAGASLNSGDSNNICIGNAGLNGNTSTIYIGTTSNNNIYIGNAGANGENGTIRIGSNQTTTTIAGIYNGRLPNNGTAFPVYVDSGGHLGPNPNPSGSVYFAGIVGIQTAPNAFPLCVGANCFCDGTSGWYSGSDRNIKSQFEPVDTGAILEKVAAMPITRWRFTNDLAYSHIGPMAQDFYSAFDIGKDDKHIGSLDESGVALAAIQGLNQKLTESEAEIAGQKEEISNLKARLDKFEQLISKQK